MQKFTGKLFDFTGKLSAAYINCMFEEFERLENEPLSHHSTIKIGGPARWILFPKSVAEIAAIFEICKTNKIKTFILGNGSNVLFSDEGFDGAIINLKHFDGIKIFKNLSKNTKNIAASKNFYCKADFVKNRKNNKNHSKNAKKCLKNRKKRVFLLKNTNLDFLSGKIFSLCKEVLAEIGAGINLFALNLKLQKMGLSGLEFSYGIPATLGGFVVMNGGCFGHEIGQLVEAVSILKNGRKVWIKKEKLVFGYRTSNLKNCVILSAKLRFFCEKSEKIAQNLQFFINKKKNLQPCDVPSLGSVFKRSMGADGSPIFPAKVIDDLGLKGFCVGGAQVSPKHAGFIVNTAGATSHDVLALIEFLEKKLLSCKIAPEREIIVLK